MRKKRKSYNWNVYKVFKSGKRAKNPLMTFDYGGSTPIEQFFENKIKTSLSEKLRKSEYIVLRSDLVQDREEDPSAEEKRVLARKRQRVFSKYIKDTRKLNKDVNISGGLILCNESKWKWQWAVTELATNRYLSGVSPKFRSYDRAEEWMDKEIKKL